MGHQPHRTRLFFNEYGDEICQRYSNGWTTRQLAAEYHIDRGTLREFFRRRDFTMRNGGNYDAITPRPRRYVLDESFFETIDTENKAYVLGLLYADGNVLAKNGYTMSISLQDKDSSLLETVKTYLGFSGPIRRFYQKPRKWRNKVIRGGWQRRLTVSSKKLVSDLIRHGCVPAKTAILRFPITIDDALLVRHFVRGFFDGDGSVYVSKTRMIEVYMGIKSKAFSDGLSDYLRQYGIETTVWVRQPDILYCNKMASQEDAIKLYKLLYDDHSVCLERKRDRYLAGISGVISAKAWKYKPVWESWSPQRPHDSFLLNDHPLSIASMCHRYLAGETIKAIAADLQLDKGTLTKILKDSGIKIRNRADYPAPNRQKMINMINEVY